MYARLGRFRLKVNDPSRTLAEGEEEPGVALLTSLEGCRGAWALTYEEESGQEEQRVVFFSLWDTREQAETAGQRMGPRLGEMLAEYQLEFLAPPEVEVLRVDGARLPESLRR